MKNAIRHGFHDTHSVCRDCIDKVPGLRKKPHHGFKPEKCCFCGGKRSEGILGGFRDDRDKTDCLNFAADTKADVVGTDDRIAIEVVTDDSEQGITEEPVTEEPKASGGSALEDLVEILPVTEKQEKYQDSSDHRQYLKELRQFALDAIEGREPQDVRWRALKAKPKKRYGTAGGHPDLGKEGVFWVGRKPSVTHLPGEVMVIMDRSTDKMLCLATRWLCRDTTSFGSFGDRPEFHICRNCYATQERLRDEGGEKNGPAKVD